MSTPEVTQRLTPTKETLNRLFAVSGNVCAFPGCSHPLFDEDFDFVAQVCHIEGAMPDGERFNANSNNEDRRKLENLMGMCLRHHVKTNNVDKYPTDKLREMKREHEAQFSGKGRQQLLPPIAVDKAYEAEKRLSEQILATVKTTDAKVDILIAMNEQLTAFVTANLPASGDSPFKSEIDTIISLRSSLNQEMAIELFNEFRAKNWSKLNPHEKFRVAANMGICYLDIGKEPEAADLFLEGYIFQPELLKAMSLASLAYTIKGDHENARKMIDKTLESDAVNADALQALIHQLSAEGKSFECILTSIPEAVRKDQEIAYALGFVAKDQGKLHEAINWIQIALDNAEGTKANLAANLASVLLDTVDRTAFILNGAVDQASKNTANLAIQYFDEALAEVTGNGLQESRSQWLVNRAIAKKFLGDRHGAYEDTLAANGVFNTYETSRHLAIAAMENGMNERMWEALDQMLEQAVSKDERQQAELTIAEMDIAEGRKEKGIITLENLNDEGIVGKEGQYVRNKLVEMYTLDGRMDAAFTMITQIINDEPQSVKTYLTKTQYLLFQGKNDEAKASLAEASLRIKKDTPAPDIHELVDLSERLGNFKQAAEQLEKIADLKIYSRLTRQLLMAYYQAGETQKLVDACNELLNAFGPLDMVTELLSYAYEGIDDLASAVGVLTNYLEKYPGDQMIQARLAFVYHRQFNNDALNLLLSTIDHIDTTLPLEVQFRLVRMFRYIGDYTNFRRFAYEIRRNFYEQPKAHEAFLSMSVASGEETEKKAFASVSVNSAVTLRVNEKPVTYILEDNSPLFASRGEISPESEMGRALLGKKIGGIISVEHEGRLQEFTILHIADKFDHAASETVELLTTQFAANTNTRKLTLTYKEDGSPDLEQFFAPLKQAQQGDDYLETVYKQQKLPIGVAAGFQRISPIRSWAGFMASAELGVFTTGPFQEMGEAEKAVKGGKPMVLDILAITTLSSLEALEDVQLLPNEKIVTHSTLEELYDLIHEQEQSSKSGSFTVGLSKGQYVKQVLSPENVQAQIQHLQDLAEWVKANCTIVPTMAGLKMNAFEKQELNRMLGKSFVDSVLTAKERDAFLYAEEMPLRGYAYTEHKVKGGATFMVLRILKEQKLITHERYREKTLHLIAMNYKFIPVEADVLYLAAEKSKFTLAFPFDLAKIGLTAPMMLPGMAIAESVKFFYKLFIEKLTVILSADNTNHIETLVIATLDELMTIFPAKNLEEALMRNIDRVFMFIPVQQQKLRVIIRNYFSRL